MARRIFLAFSAAFVLAQLCSGQIHGGSHGHSRGNGGSGAFFGSHHHAQSAIPRGYFIGDTPFLYSDYPFEPAIPETAPPPVTAAPTPSDTPAPAKAAPLLIELQGDRYVRYGGASPASEREPAIPVAGPGLQPSGVTGAQTTLAPTVLVYRDGHREEVPDYAIVGRTMYAHNGIAGESEYGIRNIQLSVLDLPATLKANRDNGVRFVLPAGPNEVVTRP